MSVYELYRCPQGHVTVRDFPLHVGETCVRAYYTTDIEGRVQEDSCDGLLRRLESNLRPCEHCRRKRSDHGGLRWCLFAPTEFTPITRETISRIWGREEGFRSNAFDVTRK